MRKKKNLIRTIAIVLAVLLVGGVVFSAIVGALAEEAPRDRYEITMEYLPEGQALQITQRLTYTNRQSAPLQEVVFYAAGNMFRRESALMYESDDLESVFFDGYAPAGIDLQSVRFNDKPTDFGFQGEQEMVLRVNCALAPGESGVFEFSYYLLLMRCGAFQGVGETDVRLSAFCLIPGIYDSQYGEFIVKRPLPHTRWLYCDAADYSVQLTLPRGYEVASGGVQALEQSGERCVWRIDATNVRELAVSFGRRYRVRRAETESGVRVRVLSRVRGADRRALDITLKAVNQCEAWFGAFPVEALDIVQSDYPLGALAFPGVIWISDDLLRSGKAGELAKQLRVGVARQYFGFSAYVEPSADAWMSDSVCEYLAYLLLEAQEGHEAFLEAVNRDWKSALGITIPGGKTITSDAQLFDGVEYDVVVRKRGAVVLHELREAMGRDALLRGLAVFHDMGRDGHTLTELELVEALDAAGGGPWEDFLTDWLFNIDEYMKQTEVWFY